MLGNSSVSASVLADTECYLTLLERSDMKKGKYIEVEINVFEQKLIIRDNLKHTDFQNDISDVICNGSTFDYGPVLGWNRICLE